MLAGFGRWSVKHPRAGLVAAAGGGLSPWIVADRIGPLTGGGGRARSRWQDYRRLVREGYSLTPVDISHSHRNPSVDVGAREPQRRSRVAPSLLPLTVGLPQADDARRPEKASGQLWERVDL
jgi:hypothetical protein